MFFSCGCPPHKRPVSEFKTLHPFLRRLGCRVLGFLLVCFDLVAILTHSCFQVLRDFDWQEPIKNCWASGSIQKHWVVRSMYAIQTCLLQEMFSQIMCSCRLYTHLFLHMITSNQKRTYSSPFLSLSTPLPSSSTWNRQFWHRGHITPATDTVSTMVHQSHREKPRNTRDHLYDTNPNNALFSGNASIFSIHVQLLDSKRMDNLLTLEYPRDQKVAKKTIPNLASLTAGNRNPYLEKVNTVNANTTW